MGIAVADQHIERQAAGEFPQRIHIASAGREWLTELAVRSAASHASSPVEFVIGGSTAETVLIRASGPALAPFGVTGTLPDPELQLYSTASGGTLLATSTGWTGSPQIAEAAASVGDRPATSAPGVVGA